MIPDNSNTMNNKNLIFDVNENDFTDKVIEESQNTRFN